MRPSRFIAAAGALALTCAGFATATPATAATTAPTSYVVLAKAGANVHSIAQRLEASGNKINSVNAAIGLVSVTSTQRDFTTSARTVAGVQLAGVERQVGQGIKPTLKPKADKVEKAKAVAGARQSHGKDAASKKGFKGATDPLDAKLWGMDMMDVPEAHKITMGDKRVTVGIMDTGVDASHPDIAPNFNHKLSRNFVTDIPAIDGPCEYDGCVDPADASDDAHGTHVAGTIGAAMNGLGVSGVAPDVSLVNVRAGQDSGFFFLTPVVNALTYSGDAGIDVVNMSFYLDPWLFNCAGGAPEDGPEAAAAQDLAIEAMTRALRYAHDKGTTLIAAEGNEHTDMANPGIDKVSPGYDSPAFTWDDAPYARTIDNKTCLNLPTEDPNVIGVTSVGPSGQKAYYSNYTTDIASGEVEVAAPGGSAYDPALTRPDNMILSSVPLNVLQASGQVDADGNIAPADEGWVLKDCQNVPGQGEVCGYYEYMQGTSMASPAATGVAALIVSQHGKQQGRAGFGLAPDRVKSILMSTAVDHACPAGGVVTYPELPASARDRFAATCVGDASFNGIYGDGIVNARNAVAGGKIKGHAKK